MKIKLKPIKLERRHRMSLTISYSLIVFIILIVTAGLFAATIMILAHNGVIVLEGNMLASDGIIIWIGAGSVLLGSILTFFISRIPLRPVNKMINALNRLASGNYKTRIHYAGPLGKNSSAIELSESFNRLAEELEQTEMLRSDFINNFSHEFKTPIVSISGFAGLLRHGHLTEEQQKEYIDIIYTESKRLEHMATNVLNLTKLENQSILTDISTFNVSEQIRNSVLLLESKWSKKDIELDLDFDEYMISGNEEMLQQVWINLTDNAVKFTPDGGKVAISIRSLEDRLEISFLNTGVEIPPEALERIFQKFYQADTSHTTEGNGIGLAVVKQIVRLHQGEIGVASENGETVFTIVLPTDTPQPIGCSVSDADETDEH